MRPHELDFSAQVLLLLSSWFLSFSSSCFSRFLPPLFTRVDNLSRVHLPLTTSRLSRFMHKNATASSARIDGC